MITEEMLKQAAEKANEAIIESIPLAAGKKHVFSEKYKRNMKRLTSKAKHPVFYAGMRRVAGFILMLLIGGTLLLATNSEARAKVIEWIKTQTENLTIYRFEGEESNQEAIPEFDLGYIPDGYMSDLSFVDSRGGHKTYVNEGGKILTLIYKSSIDSSVLVIVNDEHTIENIYVNNYPAELYTSKNPDDSPCIIWKDEEMNILFSVSGFFDTDELISICQNIIIKN